MSLTNSKEQLDAALAALEACRDAEQVSVATGIPIEILEGCLKERGAAVRVRRAGGGRKPVLDEGGLQVLRELIQANGRLTLDELAAAFTERTGKSVSQPTVSKAMKALGFRKVKLQKAPSTPAPQSTPRYGKQHRREPTETTYPSTLTDREWAALEPLLVKKDGRGRPPKHDRRLMLNAIFYQVRTGNQWRYLPKDFPPWTAVWSVFHRMRDSGMLERMYDALHQLWRQVAGRAEVPTAGIVDSQTVKTTEKGGLAATTQARRSRAASGIWLSIPSDFPAKS